MKRILLGAVAGLAFCSMARAKDVSIALPDTVQTAIANLPNALDQCVAGVTMRGDATACKSVSQFLARLAVEVRAAQEKAAAEDRAAQAEADKKAPEPK